MIATNEKKKNKFRTFSLGLLICSLWLSTAALGAAGTEKYEVINENVKIRLSPDKESQVVETVVKGSVLTKSSSRKFRKVWNYVYFYTEKKGIFKSGYIMDKDIKKISKRNRSQTLHIK